MKKSSLDIVESALLEKRKRGGGGRPKYVVPSLWLGRKKGPKLAKVDPFAFFLSSIRRAINQVKPRKKRPTGGEWTRGAVVYNMFVRTTTAFDHDRDGKLGLPLNKDGFRETGTFLKGIALLPFLKEMGVDCLHLLPVTSIGHDGNKGSLGSPYAIRNPFEVDDMLSEPILGLDVKTEFRAFVEAAHRMGFRVVTEFVFRTAAKDSHWVKQHPEWFYWIREEVRIREPHSLDENSYGSPIFTHEELERIHQDVGAGQMDSLLPPHTVYRGFFTDPPSSGRIEKQNGRYRGTLADGQSVKIPGAFADWPPDDTQPPWGDVTYLKMYSHPDFNYIGYNTIRMYDSRLARPEHRNESLWEKIAGIIPFYQETFGIDGVMIDMGHALPMNLKKRMIAEARESDPDFAFWDENFSVTHQSRDEGYNAVVGHLWLDEPHPDRMKAFFRRLEQVTFPIAFFGTAETHNTPRAASRPGGVTFAKWSLVVNSFIPAVLFIHSGIELGEKFPINTGLDFTKAELRELPAEKLPLFSDYGFNWASKDQLHDLIRRVTRIRAGFRELITDNSTGTFRVMEDENEAILSFERCSGSGKERLAVVTNSDFRKSQKASVNLETRKRQVYDLLTRKKLALRNGVLKCSLKPGECLVFQV